MATEKYAVGEYERRFLLDDVPGAATNPRRIIDRYIVNTRLRLRTVDGPDGAVVRKLGQKRRVRTDDPRAIMCTSVYLDEAEFDLLAGLPARTLIKTRWAVDVAGHTCAIDVFESALAGLILLEVAVHDPARLDEFAVPAWVGPEVTDDESFTGGELAGRSLHDLRDALAAARA